MVFFIIILGLLLWVFGVSFHTAALFTLILLVGALSIETATGGFS